MFIIPLVVAVSIDRKQVRKEQTDRRSNCITITIQERQKWPLTKCFTDRHSFIVFTWMECTGEVCCSAAAKMTSGQCVKGEVQKTFHNHWLLTRHIKSHNVDPRVIGTILWYIQTEITWHRSTVHLTKCKSYIINHNNLNKGVWDQTPWNIHHSV